MHLFNTNRALLVVIQRMPFFFAQCRMPKDARYRTAQKLILAGMVKSLADLFDIVDKTPLARDMHTALIGRDILSQAVLIYIGYNNSFTLSF